MYQGCSRKQFVNKHYLRLPNDDCFNFTQFPFLCGSFYKREL